MRSALKANSCPDNLFRPQQIGYPVRILFICKQRHQSGGTNGGGCFGLYTSASLLASALKQDCEVVTVIDGNDIDRVVTQYKPDIVVIEALWVTPAKLAENVRLHPTVHWIVRIHSKAPFLAQEGIALEWIREYQRIRNVVVAVNNWEFAEDLKRLGFNVEYLPNIYSPDPRPEPFGELPGHVTVNCGITFQHLGRRFSMDTIRASSNEVHVGCFGALRPMKNHLHQALAAIQFAERIGRRLRFHINVADDEGTANVLRNLRALLHNSLTHRLVEHGWLPHARFRDLVATMDIGMQVSFSESFNIVTADFVDAGVPVVASKEIAFVHWLYRCEPTTAAMTRTLLWAWRTRWTWLNRRLLHRHNRASDAAWNQYLSGAAPVV